MSDYYTESQVNRIEEDAYNGAMLEAGKEWERQRDEFNSREHELEARIAELEAERHWIPVSERLPETKDNMKYYDVILEGENSVAVALWDGWCKSWNLYEAGDGYVSTTLVTHWRERPTLPEVQE